jgi:DNA-binding GntR family transcriptional regulator
LRKQVLELLRNAIISMEFKPGERLVERDLCDRFGVSRTVIREVLRHLEAEGLVAIVPNRGPVIAVPTPDEARSLYEVRAELEPAAARMCAERANAAQKRKLASALTRFEATVAKHDLADQLAAKDAFYEELFAGAGNPIIAAMLRTIQARVQMLRGLSLSAPGRAKDSIAELRRIVNAIGAGDGRAAQIAASEHVRNAGTTALSRLGASDSSVQARGL